MSTAEILTDTLTAPARGLAAAAERRSFVAPLALATLASLALALVATPRLDLERAVDDALESAAAAAPTPQPVSPHDREVALARAEKIGRIGAYADGLLGPALRALGVAAALFAAFALLATPAPFGATLAVVAWGSLPLALRALLSLPAVLSMRGVTPDAIERALPSSAAALLPATAPPRLAAAASSLDLFSAWAVVLVALGMAHATGTARGRALAVVLVLFASYVLVRHVALPGLAAVP
ncbi:MAG: YIP1 family protein [Anaeromyxobacteraceae bacterium]